MFKKILHFTKSEILQILPQQKPNLTSYSNLLYTRSIFLFSQNAVSQKDKNQKKDQINIQIESQSTKYYKQSIRKANINDKGRAKFTQFHLTKLIRLAKTPSDQALMFEAYYNFLGHFTIFRSKCVDAMLLKSMEFQTCSISKILDIYQNHNYLAYFPQYTVTNNLINTIKDKPQEYQKLLNILIVSPLIKINLQILQNLIEQINNIETTNTIFSLILKLIVSRSQLNLFEGLMDKRQTLRVLNKALKVRIDNNLFKTTKKANFFTQWCNSIQEKNQASDQLHYQLSTVAAYFQSVYIFADNLIQIKDQNLLIDALLFLEYSHSTFQRLTIQYLQSLNISQGLKARLNQFKNTEESDPAVAQSQ